MSQSFRFHPDEAFWHVMMEHGAELGAKGKSKATSQHSTYLEVESLPPLVFTLAAKEGVLSLAIVR